MSAHGTVSAYLKQKCRCEPCRQAMSAYMTAYRKKNTAFYDQINLRKREESAARTGKPVRPARKPKPKQAFTDRQIEIAIGVMARMNPKENTQ